VSAACGTAVCTGEHELDATGKKVLLTDGPGHVRAAEWVGQDNCHRPVASCKQGGWACGKWRRDQFGKIAKAGQRDKFRSCF
jgi:hypothetical protein